MLTIQPKIFPTYITKRAPKQSQIFTANYAPVLAQWQTKTNGSNPFEIMSVLPWLKDSTISNSINYLKNLEFDKEDIKFVQNQGAVLPFLSGKEALDFINSSNVRIKFDTLASPKIHAQYDYENNFIKINDLYKNTKNQAETIAIAEAILHEAGHAKDKDGGSSIQEEINCLSLNAISHRAFCRKYPNAFLNTNSLIVKDGVCVYAELFFDKDPTKNKLVERITQKYGSLPAGDLKHPPSGLAFKVKNAYISTQNTKP